MKVKILVATIIAALAVGGCATNYDKYLASVEKVNASVKDEVQLRDAARQLDAQQINAIAAGGSDTAKVAAVMAIAMQNVVASIGQNGASGGSKYVVPQAPTDPLQGFYQLLGLVVPNAVQAFGIIKNAQVATTQSNNSAAVAISTNSAFTNIATAGFTSLATVNPQANVTTTNTFNAGGDLINGNSNSTVRRNCNGGTSTATGNGGSAAAGGAGGAGGAGTTAGGAGAAGAASGNAGAGTPTATAGGGTC